ncbi:MAG TPA: regulatory protein RecX [Bryobacteraceae bacterium]|jgi:regulatory protein
MKLLDRDHLLEYAQRVLGMRALSIGELKQKLRLRAAVESDVDSVLSVLKQAGALNDRTFADSYAAARRTNQGFGQHRVLRDLMVKRVPSTVAKEAVREAYENTNELELIAQFLERKYRGKDLKVFLEEEKNLASAYRRLRTAGYSSSNSIKVLKRYASRAEEIPEDDSSTGEES